MLSYSSPSRSQPDASLDFEAAIVEARRLFSLLDPEAEFLPAAPNPEDIIFNDSGHGSDDDAAGAGQEAAGAGGANNGDGDHVAADVAPAAEDSQNEAAPGPDGAEDENAEAAGQISTDGEQTTSPADPAASFSSSSNDNVEAKAE